MNAQHSIREIIGKLDPSPRSYYAVESFILRLLGEYLKAAGKIVQTEPEIIGLTRFYKHQIDALVPDGIDGLPGPTLIEIRLSKRPQMLLKIFDRLATVAEKAKCKSVLLIFGNELRDTYRNKIEQFWRQSSPTIALEIWDIEKIDAIMADHSEAFGICQ